MIQISHEFPNYFYKNGYAKDHTDYDYCLVHRYIEDEDYRSYMKDARKHNREIVIDNSVYELKNAFRGDEYAKAIEDLEPTYYLLPDTFNNLYKNIETQLEFYNKYSKDLPGTPMSALQGETSSELVESFKVLSHELPENTRFALPFGSAAFDNANGKDPMMYNSLIFGYTPMRMAINRKKFLRIYNNVLRSRDFHLLGCKSIMEYDIWDNDYDKSFIKSTDTSLPVAYTLQTDLKFDDQNQYMAFGESCISMDPHFFKPEYLIDKHFHDEEFSTSNLDYNIDFFRKKVITWYETQRN